MNVKQIKQIEYIVSSFIELDEVVYCDNRGYIIKVYIGNFDITAELIKKLHKVENNVIQKFVSLKLSFEYFSQKGTRLTEL